MPHISPGGPGSEQSQAQGPFTPLQNEVSRVRLMLGFAFDDPERVLQEIVDETLLLPPEERFTESGELVKRRIQEEFGDLDTARAALPNFDEQQVVAVLIDILNQLIESTLENVWWNRDAEQSIVLASGYAAVLSGFLELRDAGLDDREKRQLMSSSLAFLARAISLQQAEDGGQRETLVRDVAYTLYYVEDAIAEESDVFDPTNRSFEEVRGFVREYGAGLAYTRLDISLGRGAELAGVSRFEFEEILETYDVEPRRGPSDVSELYDGVGIMND